MIAYPTKFILPALYGLMLTNITLYSVRVSDVALILCLIFIFLLDGFKLRLNDNAVVVAFYSAFITLYVSIVSLFSFEQYFSEIIRAARVLVVFYITARMFKFERRAMERWIYLFLGIHAIVVVLGAFNLEFFLFFASYVGYEKDWWPGRGLGLMSSYDTAGFFLLVGIIMLSSKRSFSAFLLSVVFLLVGFLTGRTFMVLGPIVFICFTVLRRISFTSKNGIFGIFFILFFSISLMVGVKLGFLEGILDSLNGRSGYYSTTQILFSQARSVLEYTSAFGYGAPLPGVDIGYIKAIYYGGFIYMLFQLGTVALMLLVFYNRSSGHYQIFFAIVFCIYNFKIYAFYASIFFVLYIYVLMLLGSEMRNNEPIESC